MTYSLRFPFRILGHHDIVLTGPEELDLGDELTVIMSREDGRYLLTIEGFETLEAAAAFVPRVHAALTWTTLSASMPIEAETSIDEGHVPEDPETAARKWGLQGPIELVVDGGRPAVFRTGARVAKLTAGSLGVAQTLPFERYAPVLREGFEEAGVIREDDELYVALSLYTSHFTEASAVSKFVVLVMCLEVLAEPAVKHPVALALLEKWHAEVDQAAETHTDEPVLFALESLRRELLIRRQDSLRGRIRRLVSESLDDLDPEERSRLARRAVELYDLRSTMIHTGKIGPELGQAIVDSKDIAVRLLQERVRAARSG